MGKSYTKKPKNNKKTTNKSYKRRAQTNKKNNNYDLKKKVVKAVEKEEVKRYKIVDANEMLMSQCSVYFKPKLFHKKFKIPRKNRIILLNNLGLLPFNSKEKERFAKYYTDKEQKELRNIFDIVFVAIEDEINKNKYSVEINRTHRVFVQYDQFKDLSISRSVQLTMDFGLTAFLDGTRTVAFYLGDCLQLICSYLKIKNLLKSIDKCIGENKSLSTIDRRSLSSINGFIYENISNSYGLFINHKEDKRSIVYALEKICENDPYSNGKYDASDYSMINFHEVIHKCFNRVKMIRFDK